MKVTNQDFPAKPVKKILEIQKLLCFYRKTGQKQHTVCSEKIKQPSDEMSSFFCVCVWSREKHLINNSELIFQWSGRQQLFSVSRLQTLWLSGGGLIRAGAPPPLTSEAVKGIPAASALIAAFFCCSLDANTGATPHTCICVCVWDHHFQTVPTTNTHTLQIIHSVYNHIVCFTLLWVMTD